MLTLILSNILVPIPYLTRLGDDDSDDDNDHDHNYQHQHPDQDQDHDHDIIISPTNSNTSTSTSKSSKPCSSMTSLTHRSFSLSSNTTIHYYDSRLPSTALRLSRALGIGGIGATITVIGHEKEHADGTSNGHHAAGISNGHTNSSITDVPPPGIHLIITPSFTDTRIPLSNSKLEAECYELCILDSHTITIKAAHPKGIFYGCMTLEQMFETSTAGISVGSVPLVTIVDGPKCEWRACHLDCARHFMDVDFIKRFLELLAYHKINRFHWHLTDDQGWRLQSELYPNLSETGAWRENSENDTESPGKMYGGLYTHDDVRDVLAFASELHIEVIPEIELPGHSTAALASYPDLGCTGSPYKVSNRWGIHEDVFCAGNENVFVFLEGVLSEVINLFPSKYIHIGGDECPKTRWEQCHKCQKRMRDNGLNDCEELQSWFVKRIAAFLTKRGKIVIGWDEIHEGGLPEGVVVQSWRDWRGAIDAVRLGHNAITSPVSHCYFDWGVKYINLERVYSFEPIPRGLTPSQELLILGSEACMWTEFAPRNTVLGKVFPRLLALSTKMWTLKQRTDNLPFLDFFETVTMYHIPRLKRMGVECSDGMSESFKARA